MEGTGETEQRREKTKQDGQCVFHEKKLMLEILKRVRKETPVVQSLPRRPRSAISRHSSFRLSIAGHGSFLSLFKNLSLLSSPAGRDRTTNLLT